MQTDPVSEMFYFLEYQTMGKVQKLSNPDRTFYSLDQFLNNYSVQKAIILPFLSGLTVILALFSNIYGIHCACYHSPEICIYLTVY
jgi:Zn-dependent oligopeptidase